MKEMNDREWAKLLNNWPTGIRPDFGEGYIVNNDIYVTKEAMEEILNWNKDEDEDEDKDANVRPRGYREQQLIFDDEVSMDPELLKEIVDGFIMPTGEELVKIMSPLFSTPYITNEDMKEIFTITPIKDGEEGNYIQLD